MKTYWVFMTIEIEAESHMLAQEAIDNVLMGGSEENGSVLTVWTVDSINQVEEAE